VRPKDLLDHACIRQRVSGGGRLLEWTLRAGRERVTLDAGTLERVLPQHALVREAFFLYFPSQPKLPPKLRSFVDWFREKNDPGKPPPPVMVRAHVGGGL
jgi:DNA-binding transcriptional LysR family regulator